MTTPMTERKPPPGNHTAWNVYCRTPGPHCQEYPVPRLDRRRAIETAREHTARTGHKSEVVRIRYEPQLWIEMSSEDGIVPDEEGARDG